MKKTKGSIIREIINLIENYGNKTGDARQSVCAQLTSNDDKTINKAKELQCEATNEASETIDKIEELLNKYIEML